MFDRFRYKFMQFMQGRYGADKFSQFLSGVILVLIILELIFRNPLLWWQINQAGVLGQFWPLGQAGS